MSSRRHAKGPPFGHSMMGAIMMDPVSIDILPDEALLEIFIFCLIEPLHHLDYNTSRFCDRWRTLVHVCRRWRYIVFASPHGLDLRLVCTAMTPVKTMLNVWPTLPLVILGNDLSDPVGGVDNIIAALERHDRIREISFWDMPTSLLETLATSMQEPLPDLTSLLLKPLDEMSPLAPPVLADSFLGGSAPRLRTLAMRGITILSLRNLLLSAHDLVTLHLWCIPHYGYISPEVLVTCLSAMPNLKEFRLGFQSPLSRPDQASGRLLPLTRVVLPSLTYFEFKGVSEYLEDIVAQIDLPSLDRINITLFNQLIFNTPHLQQFISREESLGPCKQVAIWLHNDRVAIQLSTQQDPIDPPPKLTLEVSCTDLEWQLSSVVQFCDSSLLPLRTTERLRIFDRFTQLRQLYDIENTQWLELLYPFIHVKEWHIYNFAFAQRVATSLQELTGENLAEVLLAGQDFSTSMQPEHLQELIGKLADAIRASFAKYLCPFPGCLGRFMRRQEMERHAVSRHLPHSIYCIQPDCGWTSNRRDELRKHYKKAHPGVPFPGQERCMIYNTKGLVRELLNEEITGEQAVCEARLSFQCKAAELGKQGIWRE